MLRQMAGVMALLLVGCGTESEVMEDAPMEDTPLQSQREGMIVGGNDLIPVAADGSNVPAKYRPLLDAFGLLTIGTGGFCTATHLGSGVVMTAGHCFAAGSGGQTNIACPANTTVSWGKRAGTGPNLVSSCTRILAMQNSGAWDYAFIEVSPPPSTAVGFQSNAGGVGNPVGSSATIFSHPQARDLEWSQTCYIPPLAAGFLHSCDTESGSSGAAVIEDDSLQVVGVNHSNNGIHNQGIYLDHTPIGWLWRAHRPTGELKAWGGKCLDAQGGGTANGTPFQLHSCNGSSAQTFRREGLAFVGNAGKCLDAPSATVGATTRLFDCQGSGSQQWRMENVELRHLSGKCVDVPFAHDGSGTWLFDCWGGPNQKWTVTDSGLIRAPDGRCLDVPWSTANGTPVWAYACHGGANQRWTFNQGGEIRGLGGKCLDLADGDTTNRTPFRLWDCNGSAAQKFHLRGEIRGPGGLCLDNPWSTSDGTLPLVWDCHGGENQKWEHRW